MQNNLHFEHFLSRPMDDNTTVRGLFVKITAVERSLSQQFITRHFYFSLVSKKRTFTPSKCSLPHDNISGLKMAGYRWNEVFFFRVLALT